MATDNPYTNTDTPHGVGYPNRRYAVPDDENANAPYNNPLGWSPSLRTAPDGLPDSERLGVTPIRDYRGGQPENPPEVFYDQIDADKAERSSVETVDANGWQEKQGVNAGETRWAPNPRSVPSPLSRVTQLLSPSSYSFTRPFGTGTPKIGAKQFTGEHFSMADHRRNYEIHGMQPVRSSRNTYRLDPTPWDIDIVDKGPETNYTPDATIVSTPAPYPDRSWRLS